MEVKPATPKLFACKVAECSKTFKHPKSVSRHIKKAHPANNGLKHHPFEQRPKKASYTTLWQQVACVSQQDHPQENTVEADDAVAAVAPHSMDESSELVSMNDRKDSQKLWKHFSRGNFVKEFFSNINYNDNLQKIAVPVCQLIQCSRRNRSHNADYYLALMSTLRLFDCCHRKIDGIFLIGLSSSLFAQWQDQMLLAPWAQLVITFTWGEMILKAYPHLYPDVKRFCERFMRLIEHKMIWCGGWQSLAAYVQSELSEQQTTTA